MSKDSLKSSGKKAADTRSRKYANSTPEEKSRIDEIRHQAAIKANVERKSLQYIVNKFKTNPQYFDPSRPSAEKIEEIRQHFVKVFSPEKILQMKLKDYAEGYKDPSTGKKLENSFCTKLAKLPTFGSINNPYGMLTYGVFIRSKTQIPDYDKKKYHSVEEASQKTMKAIIDLLDSGKLLDINEIEKNPLHSLFKSKILCVYYPEKYLNIHSKTAIKQIVIDLKIANDEELKEKSIFEIEQLLLRYKNEKEFLKNLTNNEYGHMLWAFYDKGTPSNRKILIRISNYLDEFLGDGVPKTQIQVLKKLFKMRGKYLNSSKIYGTWIGQGDDRKKIPLQPDDLVEEPHYIHSLVPGVYKPEKSQFAQTVQLNPHSRWDLEIDRTYPTLRIPYNFKDSKTYANDISYLEKCQEIGLPIGLLFQMERDKYKVLGLGKIISHKGTEFIIESYGISDEESAQLKEKTLKEYDTISQDPDLGRIDDINFTNLFEEINFHEKFSEKELSESYQGEPHSASIPKIIDLCKTGTWVIPNFQRFFDWDKNMVKKFINSIFYGYYVGSLLLWETDGQQKIGVTAIRGIDIEKNKLRTDNIVIDGQQRITSLYYAIKSPDYPLSGDRERSFFYIHFSEFFSGTPEEVIKVFSKEIDPHDSYSKLLFPLNQLLQYNKWIKGLRQFLKDQNPDYEYERDILPICDTISQKLDFIKEKFEIPYIGLENISINDVIEIFGRINTTGKKLDSFDLLIAILSKNEIELRKVWEKTCKDNPKIKQYYEKPQNSTKGLSIMQALSLCHSTSKSCKQKDILKIYENIAKSKEDFTDKWYEMVEYTNAAIEHIEDIGKDGFGVIDRKWLPFEPMIQVLASLLWLIDHKFSNNKKTCYEKLSNWYWVSVFGNMYSSAVDTQKTTDYNTLRKWFKTDEVPDYIKKFRNNFDRNLNLVNVERTRSSVFRGILSLLALKGANDWDQNRAVLNQTNFKNNKVDVDHIFPKSKYGKDPFNESILNKTWLAKETNERLKRAKEPEIFAEETIKKNFKGDINEFEKTTETHFINKKALGELMKNESEEFVVEREKEILKEIGIRIGSKKTQFQTSFETETDEDNIFSKDISELLKMKETLELEFKSTMKFDLRQNQPSKDRVYDIVKNIAAFMNAKGGLLVIGYDDDNDLVIGIEKDYPHVGKKGWDSWQNSLITSCREKIGKSVVSLYLEDPVSIKHEGKTLAKIKLKASDEPVYVDDDIFYLRQPGQTVELKGRELDKYKKARFSND